MSEEKSLEDIEEYERIEDMPKEEMEEIVELTYKEEMPPIKPIPYVGEVDQEVQYHYEELTALCPMTGIQDTYEVTIEYIPDEFVPELKSLKFYFLAFKDLRISHEHLQAKIFKEFKEAVQPKDLKVHLDVAVRGGIKTDVTFEK